MAYTAWQEWTSFGRSTVVYGGQAGGYINRSGVTERSEPLTSKIGDYWGSCGHPEWNGRTSSKPWSGAFVAWVMAQSGIRASEFPRDGRHGRYLAALYDREQHGGRAAFELHAPNEYAPKPGDLVCTGTAGPTWRHADSRTARRRIDSTASHCDIVSDVRGGYVQAIGGNVKNSVTMSLYPGRFARPAGAVRRQDVVHGGREAGLAPPDGKRTRRADGGDGDQQQRRRRPAWPPPPTAPAAAARPAIPGCPPAPAGR